MFMGISGGKWEFSVRNGYFQWELGIPVKYSYHTGFHGSIDFKLSIIGLGNFDPVIELGLVSGIGPGLVGPAWRGTIGGGHLDPGPGPKPPVNVDGLEVIPVTAFEIAQTSGSPDVSQII